MKRVRMKHDPNMRGLEPTTHQETAAEELSVWLAAAEECGEKIHFAVLMMQNTVTGTTSPYALCDQVDDLFPDPEKFIATGDFPAELLTCERCIEIRARYNAKEWDPFEGVK